MTVQEPQVGASTEEIIAQLDFNRSEKFRIDQEKRNKDRAESLAAFVESLPEYIKPHVVEGQRIVLDGCYEIDLRRRQEANTFYTQDYNGVKTVTRTVEADPKEVLGRFLSRGYKIDRTLGYSRCYHSGHDVDFETVSLEDAILHARRKYVENAKAEAEKEEENKTFLKIIDAMPDAKVDYRRDNRSLFERIFG